MTLKKLVVAGFAVMALMLPINGALAQDATTAAPAAGAAAAPAAPTDPKLNWLKVCDPIDNGKKACIMRQVVLTKDQFLGSFLLRDDPGQESRLIAVAAVPLGVLLPMGMVWQVDTDKPLRVPYMLCDPQMCAAQTVINESYVNKLKKGGTLKLIAKNRKNQDLVVEINLGGFTSVYDNDSTLTLEEFNKQATGATELEKQLQDRAQELRDKLSSDTSAPATDAAPAAPSP
jgi:invasion protein IalB